MSDFEITVVDVGHGNAAVIREGDAVVVVDTSIGNALLLYLESERISEVELVLLSHADADHIGGLIGLLNAGVSIGAVLLNSDATKESETWRDMVFALEDARLRGEVKFAVGVSAGRLDVASFESCELTIVAPSPELAALGVGAKDRHGSTITSNSISAVVRVLHEGIPVALLAGDMDHVSLKDIDRTGEDVTASMLVFPHHGGLPGGIGVDVFVRELCGRVSPGTVVFSNGRGRHDNPRLEVVDAVRKSCPDVYVGCTQLSNKCLVDSPADMRHLGHKYSSGSDKRKSCAGSVSCLIENGAVLLPGRAAHEAFVEVQVEKAMCRGRCEN